MTFPKKQPADYRRHPDYSRHLGRWVPQIDPELCYNTQIYF